MDRCRQTNTDHHWKSDHAPTMPTTRLVAILSDHPMTAGEDTP